MTHPFETFETSVSRREAIGAAGALSVAGVGLPGIAVAAMADGPKVCEFVGRYPVNGREINGFFAAPAGASALDVIILVPEAGTTQAAMHDVARGYARKGVYAIAPVLPADRQQMAAELNAMLPHLHGIAHGNGRARIVAV